MAEPSVMARAIQHALSRDLEELVNNHVGPAQMLLPHTEVGFILLKATANLARGTMLYALEAKLDEKTPDEICDFVQSAIADLIASTRPQVLAMYAELSARKFQAG